jgi:hypothetical protein
LDGERAFVRTAAKLTDDDSSTSGQDLFLYTDSANPATDQNLTLLTKDNEPADGTAADFLGVVGLSDDGTTVYFATGGQIIAGQPTASGSKLYRWRWNDGSPTIDYLATLKAGNADDAPPNWDRNNWSAPVNKSSPSGLPSNRRATPDGSVLLIESFLALDPVVDRDGTRDVYRWTANGGWLCVSCQVPGIPSAGQAATHAVAPRLAEEGTDTGTDVDMLRPSGELRTPMSDDGQRVTFMVRDALVPEDVNGVRDVYQWQDGVVSLISTGTDDQPATVAGASRSGDDVFFYTSQPLVGWDGDQAVDIYDARVGGGLPDPPAAPEVCDPLADGCQGGGAGSVSSDTNTSSVSGDGNASVGARKTLSLGGVSAAGRRRAARSGVLRIAVRTSAPGRLSLSARAKLGRHTSRIGHKAVGVHKAGASTVALRLSRAAKRRLRSGTGLRVTVEARQVGAHSRTMSILLPGVKS